MLFATHYHPLNAETASNPHIQQGHMAALVGPQHTSIGAGANSSGGGNSSKGGGGGGSAGSDGITFLYKLQPGPCDKSYGLSVRSHLAPSLFIVCRPMFRVLDVGVRWCWRNRVSASFQTVRSPLTRCITRPKLLAGGWPGGHFHGGAQPRGRGWSASGSQAAGGL